MKSTIAQVAVVLLVAIALGIVRNLVPTNSIEFVGKWRTLSSGEDPIVPPTAEEGDPPFISVDVAQMEFSTGRTVFVDARDPSEFECGTIPGAINIPFESLPEDSVDKFIDSSLNHMPKDTPVVVFCSGEECDLSLHLARNMKIFGYTDLVIFFGGAREWDKFGFEMERRADCGE